MTKITSQLPKGDGNGLDDCQCECHPTANVIDADHLARQRDWSRATFGPGTRTLGVLDHIRKELKEIQKTPGDVGEWVDVLILAFDGAWRAGWEPQQIIDAIKDKQARNEARSWPDWRTMSQEKAIEHVRTERVYISGPIASDPDAREHFAVAAEQLRARGVEVVNPFDVPPVDHGDNPCPGTGYYPGDNEIGHSSSVCFMRTDLRALLDCDVIYLLPGWERSKGAGVELAVAEACGMRVEKHEP